MISERRHRNRPDQRERPVQRLDQRTATPALDGEHAVHTLQRTLGNQAVQDLHSRGELGAAVTTGPPVAGPAPESEPATATEEQLEEAAAVPGAVETQPAARGAGPEAEGEAGAEPAVEGAEAEAAAEAEAEEAAAAEAGTGAAGEAPAAGPTSPSSPDEDPAFQTVVEQIETVATREQSHPPPEAASAQAQAAAEGPKKEVESKAAARQVGEMAEQKPNEFDREAFKRALKDKIEQVAPKSLKQADEFKDRNELPAVKRDLTGTVDKQKEQSQKPIAETTRAKPDTAGIKPKPFTPLDPPSAGSPPPDVGAARAAPKPKTRSEVEAPFRERSQQLDQQLAAEGVTEEQLAKAPEPEFDAALQTKRDAQTHAAQAPAAYREHEQGVLSGARTEAETAAQTETLAMHDSRSQQLDTVGGLQEQTKSKDESERATVAAKLQEIYDRTTRRVTDRLDKLDADVNEAFDDGAEAARQQFEDHVAERMRQYKEARYSGVRGKIRWGTDKLKITTLPKRVERFYVEGRDIYLAEMDTVIDGIATIVQTGLGEVQTIIAEGRTEVNKYLTGLPESLKEVGQQAASDIRTRFDALEQTVEARKEQLIDSLAQKYTEKLQAVDARIEELKAQNRSLFERAWDAVGGVVKTIIELKNLLLGVLRKAASAAQTIVQAPIEFLGNLVDGVKLGFQNFVANIWTHLKTGLITWLTGTMAEAGIQLPETFDLEGIFSLVMQILGLTYENIRAQAVNVLGEEAVSALEKGFEIFKILVTEGVAGLWQYVKEKIGDLKAMVLDKIKELVVTSVIEAGIKWILGLLSPVGAFIKACKAIYDIVTFFFERAREILALVDAIVDSILAIAQGNLAGAAKFVEDALAKAIPIVIGFLASLLGLGDLPEKVKGVIKAIQAPINNAIQWVLEQAKAAAQRLGAAVGIGEEGATDEAADPSDHPTFAKHASELLKQAALEGGDSFESVRTSAKRFAEEKEAVLSASLGEGFGLRYVFSEEADGQADPTLDFRVIIAPNTTTHEDEIPIPDDPYYPMASAPGLGDIQQHGKKPSSLRDRPQIWQIESEHILPFRLGATLWEALSLYLPERGWPEDKKQTTIMIYERAARIKTEGDIEVINSFKSAVSGLDLAKTFQIWRTRYEEGDQNAISGGMEVLERVLKPYRDAKEDAIDRTNTAIQQENQETEAGFSRKNSERRAPPGEQEPPLPPADKVRTAADQQFIDVLNLLREEVLSREALTERIDRMLGR